MRKSNTADNARLDVLESMSYETRDVAMGTLVKWLVFLFAFIAGITFFVSNVLYPFFVPKSSEQERVSPLSNSASPRTKFPPNPQLQAHPVRDMIEYRTAEKQVVEGYGPGATSATASIPVDRAIDLYAARGIAGVTGSNAPAKADAYPGSGIYDNVDPSRSNNDKSGDMTSEGHGGVDALNSGDANVPASQVKGAANVEGEKPSVPAEPNAPGTSVTSPGPNRGAAATPAPGVSNPGGAGPLPNRQSN